MDEKLKLILKEALQNAYNFGRADSTYLPDEVIPGLLTRIKQAGYNSPREVKAFSLQQYNSGFEDGKESLKLHGWVALADDQTPPVKTKWLTIDEIKELGWRKVILDKE